MYICILFSLNHLPLNISTKKGLEACLENSASKQGEKICPPLVDQGDLWVTMILYDFMTIFFF